MYPRMLLYEKKDGALNSYESLLVLDASKGLVVTSKPLIEEMGKSYCMSLDGTKKKLQEIAAWKQQPTNGPDVGPFLYYVRKGKMVSE